MHKTKIKQPAVLRTFFITEMWERFGFYVVQTLLALYLARHYLWADANVYVLVGTFTALTYVSPIVGGWVADYLLGQKRTIITGGFILFFCYLLLAMAASPAMLHVALAGIAVGTGLFKPNISALLGNAYPKNAPERENGFTIFYMGITTGIIFGCTLPNYLKQSFGWSAAFLGAAAGMLLGIAFFMTGIRRYQIADYKPYVFEMKKIIQTGIAVVGLWLLSFFILFFPHIGNMVFLGIVLLTIGYFVYAIKGAATAKEAANIAVIAILCLISAIFWTFYFQMFMSLTLFIARVVKQSLFGIFFPPPYYVSIQSLGAIVFGFFLSRRTRQDLSTKPGIQSGDKFLYAMGFMMSAFVGVMVIARFSSNSILLSPLYIIPVYLTISFAELFLYPVGLSAITVLAASNKVSTMMGLFFVSLGVGGFLAGKLADQASIPQGAISAGTVKAVYAQAFTTISLLLVGAFFVCFALNLLIKRLLAHNNSKTDMEDEDRFCGNKTTYS